jgi:molybdopterin-guanine dinucleotide biosynthesis protein A
MADPAADADKSFRSQAPIRAGVILAGGPGSRLGGGKPFVQLRGRPLIAYVAAALKQVADERYVVIRWANEAAPFSQLLGDSFVMLEDVSPVQSPLVGLYTAALHVHAPYMAVVSCDVPFLNPAVLRLLFERAAGADAALPRWGNGQIEPLEAVYRTVAARVAARDAIDASEHRADALIPRLKKPRFVSTDEVAKFDPHLRTFFNVNTPVDLRSAQELLASAS